LYIDANELFETLAYDLLVPDPLAAIHHATIDILTAACTHTTILTSIKTLIDHITFSWKDKSGDILQVHTSKKLEECLQLAVIAQVTKFILHANCDLLYFAHDFDGLDLDKASTIPFPIPASTALPGITAPNVPSGTLNPQV
jgi:hypothetical protein